jgi:8-oxo-dGTP diphosphatase
MRDARSPAGPAIGGRRNLGAGISRRGPGNNRLRPAVRAAGGVVYRRGATGRREVLVVHRAHREDWTFPKGKLHRDEDEQTCARREVQEETGLRCVLGIELPATSYITRSGRLKQVRYWAMRPVAGTAGPRNEVDEVRWVGLGAATELLTYRRDRSVLLAFARLGSRRAGKGPIGHRRGRAPALLPAVRSFARRNVARVGRVSTG